MMEIVALVRTWRDRLVGIREALVDDVRIRTRPKGMRERSIDRKGCVQRVIRGDFGVIARHGGRTRLDYG